MYEECVAPLVDGLFQGYNATVLAYGQVCQYLVFNDIYMNENQLHNAAAAISLLSLVS